MANTRRNPLHPATIFSGYEVQPTFKALSLSALPFLRNGLARGSITEITGRRSSGRTAALLNILAEATSRGEVCAVVDTNDAFHPPSASKAGVDLSRLLWIRCGGDAAHAFRATDLLLHAGGFGVVALDLCEAPAQALTRIPMSYWHRFRQAINATPTALVVCAVAAQARASAQRIELELQTSKWSEAVPLGLLEGLHVAAKLCKPFEGAAYPLIVE